MGAFFVSLQIGDPDGSRYEPVDALVDTGATYTSLPASLLKRLGVEPHDRMTFIQADGSEYEREIGQTWVEVEGKRVITIVIFGEEDAPPLLGAYTLEGVLLAPDPVNRKLVSVPGYLVTRWPSADQMRALRERLLSEGVKEVEWWDEDGFTSTKFLDPDGYVVEVFWERETS